MMNAEQEINYNELVNPTFTTGQATLEMLECLSSTGFAGVVTIR